MKTQTSLTVLQHKSWAEWTKATDTAVSALTATGATADAVLALMAGEIATRRKAGTAKK